MKILVEFEFPDSDKRTEKRITKMLSEITWVKLKIAKAINTDTTTFDIIEKAVCDYVKITVVRFRSKSNSHLRQYVIPRQMCHYISCKLNLGTQELIGERFGNKGHATVIHSCKVIQNLIETDKTFKREFQLLLDSFKIK